MFIYTFMAGIVDTITGGEEHEEDMEEDFDPHAHRRVARPTTYADTMIHLLKGSIGAGILAMPDGVSRVGVLAGIVLIVLVATFAAYCILLLIEAQYQLCKRWRRGYLPYSKSMRLALQTGPPALRWAGRSLAIFVDSVLVLWQTGICCIYLIFVAENLKQVCDNYGAVYTLRIHVCWLLLPQLILNLIKNLKLLTPLSTVSNVVTIFGLILVFFYLIEEDVNVDEEKFQMKGLGELPIFIGITLFALEAVGLVLALEYNMEKPRQFVGVCGLFSIGMMIIIGLYTSIGVAGYVKYGNETRASITLNLPSDQKKAQVAKLTFAFAIFLTVPLQNFVAYTILWQKIKKKTAASKRCIIDYSLRILLVILPWGVAVLVPRLGPFISLIGAFCLSLLSIVFPAIIDLCLWYPIGYGFARYKLLRDVILIVLGVFCLCSGVYTSLLEMHIFD